MTQYNKVTETYDVKQALAVAQAVFRVYGFVKRNHGYYDADTDSFVPDSKSIVVNTLRPESKRVLEQMPCGIKKEIPVVEVTQEDVTKAEEIFALFDQKSMMRKMQGQDSTFDNDISSMFANGVVTTNRDMSILASLPNSFEIEKRRIKMDDFFRSNRLIGSFVGNVKERIKLSVDVQDVKWIPKRSVYLVTMLTDNNQIVKFFLSDTDADISEKIRNTRITFIGTVRSQSVNEHTQCQETMFNRIKILNE